MTYLRSPWLAPNGETKRKPWQRAGDDRRQGGDRRGWLLRGWPTSKKRHLRRELESKFGKLSRRQWIRMRKGLRRAARAEKWKHLERREPAA